MEGLRRERACLRATESLARVSIRPRAQVWPPPLPGHEAVQRRKGRGRLSQHVRGPTPWRQALELLVRLIVRGRARPLEARKKAAAPHGRCAPEDAMGGEHGDCRRRAARREAQAHGGVARRRALSPGREVDGARIETAAPGS